MAKDELYSVCKDEDYYENKFINNYQEKLAMVKEMDAKIGYDKLTSVGKIQYNQINDWLQANGERYFQSTNIPTLVSDHKRLTIFQ